MKNGVLMKMAMVHHEMKLLKMAIYSGFSHEKWCLNGIYDGDSIVFHGIQWDI